MLQTYRSPRLAGLISPRRKASQLAAVRITKAERYSEDSALNPGICILVHPVAKQIGSFEVLRKLIVRRKLGYQKWEFLCYVHSCKVLLDDICLAIPIRENNINDPAHTAETR